MTDILQLTSRSIVVVIHFTHLMYLEVYCFVNSSFETKKKADKFIMSLFLCSTFGLMRVKCGEETTFLSNDDSNSALAIHISFNFQDQREAKGLKDWDDKDPSP